MEDRIGQQIGNYRLSRLLGQGGFAEVYLGEHLHLKTRAAIKILQMRLIDSNMEQFRIEAQSIASLVHPHIVRVLDFGVENGVPYLIMDYAPGGTLRSHHPKGTRLPPDLVVSYIKQVAEALQFAHDRKLIHRDIKPENMLLGQNNNVLLTDFGLVLVTQGSESRSTGEIAGTVPYMAPEQIRGKPRPASDQYALGIIVYEWLSGAPPFQGALLELYGQQLYASPPLLREKAPGISPGVEEVVMTALAKNPQQRFASVQAFATALEQAYLNLQSPAPAPPIMSPWLNQSSPIIGYAPSRPSAESTYIKTPSNQIAQPAMLYTPPVPSADSTYIKTPSSQTSQPTLLNTPSGQSTPFTESGQPTYVVQPAGQSSTTHAQTSAQPQSIQPAPPVAGGVHSTGSPRPKRRRWWLVVALTLLVLLVIFGSVSFAVPGGWPSLFQSWFGGGVASSATVTITPVSNDVKHAYTISAVTGTPDPSQKQVGARTLSYTTPTRSQTANATGSRQNPAVQASGTLVIRCRASSYPITIPAGTVFTGNDGVQVATDVAVTASGCYTTVSAHAVKAGAGGNIAAKDINQPYQGYDIDNDAAFTGGQDAQTYSVVQHSDIDGAANPLVTSLTQSAQQSLKGKVRSNERLIANPQCQPNVTSDHTAGDTATSVTVSVAVTCTGETYDQDGAQSLAGKLLQDQVRTDLGAGYALVGKVVTAVMQAKMADAKSKTIAVSVNAEGVWVYQFSAAQEQALAQLIAGKKKQEALSLLSQQQGVEKVDVQLSGSDGNTFPSDSSQIKFVVLNVAGM
jgi:VCBS repeat-containing protein